MIYKYRKGYYADNFIATCNNEGSFNTSYWNLYFAKSTFKIGHEWISLSYTNILNRINHINCVVSLYALDSESSRSEFDNQIHHMCYT